MRDIALNEFFSERFTTVDGTGANADADTTPTYRVLVGNSDTPIASGDCRNVAAVVGAYEVYFQVAAATFVAGTIYHVVVTAQVGYIENADVEVGIFRAQAAGATVEPTLEQIVAEVGPGSGAAAITLIVQKGGVATEGVPVTLQSSGGSNVQTTGAAGTVNFNRDNGSWTYTIEDHAAYKGSIGTVVVAGGVVTSPADGILTITAIALPTPASADCYALYDTETDEQDLAFGAAGMTVTVADLSSTGRVDGTANRFRSVMRRHTCTDASGQWSLDIPVAAFVAGARIGLEKSWTDADGTARAETWVAVLAAPEAGVQVCLSDLQPTRESSV